MVQAMRCINGDHPHVINTGNGLHVGRSSLLTCGCRAKAATCITLGRLCGSGVVDDVVFDVLRKALGNGEGTLLLSPSGKWLQSYDK